MTRRRWIGLAGSLTVVMVATIVAIAGGGSNQPGATAKPTAAAGTSAAPPTTSAVASTAAPASTSAPAPTTTAPRTPAAAPTRLPDGIDAARAAARLFLIGFGGTRARGELLHRFAEREWGGVVLEPGNGESPQQVADLLGAIRRAAVGAGHEVPLFAASEIGGELDAVPVGAPPQSQLRDAPTARATALAVAKALHPLGVRMILGPDADVGFAGGPWDGIAYSDDPTAVASMSAAAVAGYKDGEVAAAPGHFPGEGAASGDPAVEAATVGVALSDLRARDWQPFRALVDHAPAIQLSSATYVAFDGVTPATLLPETVALLRGELRFGGVIVSGDLAAASLTGGEPVSRLAVDALKAGADLLWVPGGADDQVAAWRAVARAIKRGDVPKARVAEALARVDALRAKYGVR
ncbi:MAG TPA: glycoside hydrolase family 3 N-terminal domain-containing protein [Baekduia sp.]|uniref:glycoside hydrolase family 3 N-terminal domain-containing protein n=1 Tax=Baekduia sp. TaxID=2600305 RepID=UPI002D796174|nr:glycoside hydrolase family 3 N-terminal domain-containing protein [Baekduia sp.]HET6505208.1 glycoside hydrolase family 3 N-terminal domain-containing protein [Baekduia sp.]